VRDEFLDPGVASDVEEVVEAGLRPRALAEFVGQRELKEHLAIVLEAARRRGQSVDHLLFAGPPGSARPRSASIVATEMGVHLHITSGPRSNAPATWRRSSPSSRRATSSSSTRSTGSRRAVEEILYPAMEDFQLDIVVGKGPAASSIRLTMPPFTLVGATTRTGMITGPLRDRFGLVARLDYYDAEELQQIVTRAAGILGVSIDTDGAWQIARRSAAARRASRTGCCAASATSPRCAPTVRSPPRSRTTASRCSASTIWASTRSTVRCSPPCASSSGGPVGLSTLAISVGEQPDTVEDVYEPFLIQQGMIARTPRGRIAMPAAYRHVGLPEPAGARARPGLFEL
jgi:holliday junction DNA helicase RuvB